jgi:hypothetical protein
MRAKNAIPLAIAALMVTAMICITGVTADDLNTFQPGLATDSQIIMNGSVTSMTLVLENHTYYPNDTVQIFVYNATDPAVNITDPSGVVTNLTAIPINDSAFAFQYVLDQSIVLANYTVQATDNATGAYAVDTFQVITQQVVAVPPPENQTQGTQPLYLYINVSRPNYRPGDAVGITATTNAGTPAIVIQDPVNNTIYQNVVAEGNDTYLTTFNLNRAVVMGNYTVTAYVSGNGIYDNTTACFNVSLATPTASSNLQVRYAAYDPVQKAIVVRASINSLASNVTALVNGSPVINGMNVKSIKVFSPNGTGNVLQGTGQAPAYEDVDIVIPVNNSNVGNVTGRFNLTPDITAATTSMSINANGTDIHISLNNTMKGGWYRLSASIPTGYTVQKITRDDGTQITNNVQINRSTGEFTSDEINWYVDNGTLYFYDDPINGYDVTLSPPAANNSIAVNVIYGGQLASIVYPYNQTDNDTVWTQNDMLGRVDDNGYANQIDADAGSKTAVRMYQNNQVSGGNLMMFGNDGDAYHTYSNANYNYTNTSQPVFVGFNTVPDGSVESVALASFTASATNAPSTVNITQKTIIRNNNQWFATVYYITNTGGNNISDFRFYQGCDYNYNGQYPDQYFYYDATNDTVYGYGTAKNPIGGFRSTLTDSTYDVCQYGTMWQRIAADDLLDDTSYNGDGGVAMSYDYGTLTKGMTWVVPIIWGVGPNVTAFQNTTSYALTHNVYDVGIREIDTPLNGSSFSAGSTPIVQINATAMDLGVTDQSPTVFCYIKNSSGGVVYNSTMNVSLSIPYQETAPVSFNWNITGVAPGTYNVSVYTNLTNTSGAYIDQNGSNDLKSITVYVQNFSLGPSQAIQANPGQNVTYTLNLSNMGTQRTFDLGLSPSSAGWASNLYYNNLSTLVATDTNGDGVWNWVNSSYQDPSTSMPSITVPASANATLLLQKLVPATADTGILDTIALTAYPSGQPLANSSAILNTNTPPAAMANKTFYLHSLYLNTTPPSASTGNTNLTANSSMWSQAPAFASNFTILGNITVPIYYNTTATMPITVTLYYTNGAGSSVLIGSNTSSLAASMSVSMFNFTITQSGGSVTVPHGSYLVLEINNQQMTPFYVWYNNTCRSRINVNTQTYVNVGSINTYDKGVQSSIFNLNDTLYVTANVSDPIGAYDIASATINITAPNGTLIAANQSMTLNITDTSSPALFKLYNYSFNLNSSLAPGVYGINITGYESNGVTNIKNTSITLSAPINVTVKKYCTPASGNNFTVNIVVTNNNNQTTSGVYAYDFYASDFNVSNFSQTCTNVSVNNGLLAGEINIFGPLTLSPNQVLYINYTAQGIGNYNLANMTIVGVDPDV